MRDISFSLRDVSARASKFGGPRTGRPIRSSEKLIGFKSFPVTDVRGAL